VIENIASLIVGIKDMDANVAVATDLCMKEHEEYKESMTANVTAKKLLDTAGNRLAIRHPNAIGTPKVDMSEDQRIAENFGRLASASWRH